MFLDVLIACALLGCLTGFLAGLLGIGGGLVIVPVLIHLLPLFGVSHDHIMPVALATSLASIVFTSVIAARAHHKNDNIPWPITKQLMVTVAFGASLGAYVVDALSKETLTTIFAVAVILLASYMLLSIKVQKTKPMPRNSMINVIGLSVGYFSSLMGIAGGAILVPLLTHFSMSIRLAIGTATVCGLVVAVFGSLGFILAGLDQDDLPLWSIGYVYFPALIGIVSTSSLSAPYGVRLANKLPVRYLQRLFAIFLLIVAVKMLFS